jgi:hypothetical protein
MLIVCLLPVGYEIGSSTRHSTYKLVHFCIFFIHSIVFIIQTYFIEMNAICEHSLYNICSCKKKYHLPLTLPLYDGHCHVDLFFKYGLNYNDFNIQLSHRRKIIFIDNRHQH